MTHFSEVQAPDNFKYQGYLCSGCIKGIGPATADAVVAKFGTRTLEILDTDPNQLLMVKGIAQNKAEEDYSELQGEPQPSGSDDLYVTLRRVQKEDRKDL